MKIACCQFDPQWSKVKENMNTANELLEKYQEGDIDILVLPEMAFSGYVFKNKEEIKDLLEDEDTGPSVLWAKSQAVRLKCFVMVGYPQKGQGEDAYNSICFINPKGERVLTYQKSFLYETDENWALEGPGFVSQEIEGIGQVGFGICMDLNPYQFKSSFYEFEFANYHLEHKTRLILCSMAWLKSTAEENGSPVHYWALRLLPLYRQQQQEKTLFVACNRTGLERGSNFAGSSCVLEMADQQIMIVDQLKTAETAVLLVDTHNFSFI